MAVIHMQDLVVGQKMAISMALHPEAAHLVYGTIFKMATNGKLIWVVLHSTARTVLMAVHGTNLGHYLEASLIQASDGNLYGAAPSGGTFGDGTVFQISTNGLLAVPTLVSRLRRKLIHWTA